MGPPKTTRRLLAPALQQIPAEYIESLEIPVRADSAGATHGLIDYCHEANIRFPVGDELTGRSVPRSSNLPREPRLIVHH